MCVRCSVHERDVTRTEKLQVQGRKMGVSVQTSDRMFCFFYPNVQVPAASPYLGLLSVQF